MPRTQRTEEETRHAVTDAVFDYVAEHGIGVQPGFPMERILESAGVSRASAYRIWPGRASFSAFALEQCSTGNTLSTLTVDQVLDHAREALALGNEPVTSAAHFVASCADDELTVLLRSHRWRAFVCFQAVATGTSEPALRDALDRADSEDLERLSSLYRHVGGAWGLTTIEKDGITLMAQAAMHIARTTAARIVFGTDETTARTIYRTTLSALVRGTFRAAPNTGADRDRILDAIRGVAVT